MDDGDPIRMYMTPNGDFVKPENMCLGSSLTPQRRNDVLAPDELLKRALKLQSDSNRYKLEPNREVWKAVLTHGHNDFLVDYAQWHIDDEELFVLALRAWPSQLSFQLSHVSCPKLTIPESVSDAVLVELARCGDLFIDVLRPILRARDDAALEETLFAAGPMMYQLCRDSIRREHALGLIKCIDVMRWEEKWHPWPKLRPHVPDEFRDACERKAFIKARGFKISCPKETHPKELVAIVNLSDSIAAGSAPSVKTWSSKALQEACIEIGEFYGENAAMFLRTELKRRNFKIYNYTEKTLAFLGANLPAEEARELAIEVEPVCRKRDRKEFETDCR